MLMYSQPLLSFFVFCYNYYMMSLVLHPHLVSADNVRC
nr:MAG TPA: hypothetical protein [Caudoviricetes sp.]